MKILYVAPIFPGSTALHRLWALRSIGITVVPIDATVPLGNLSNLNFLRSCLYRVASRTNPFFDWRRVHAQIAFAAKNEKWDVLWVDKGQYLQPQILDFFKSVQPHAKLVNYSPDDMFNPQNQSERWLKALPLYDLFVTTKTYNVAEYKKAGARDALYVGNGFDPDVHSPQTLTQEDQSAFGCDVTFIGAEEKERNRSLEYLAGSKIDLGLYGGARTWFRLSKKYHTVKTSGVFLDDTNYSRILCGAKIALGFLRKVNRDQQTTRSVEIPACGVFMLAERTEEHLMLFEEGKEAEFFDGDDELLEKITFYLKHPERRLAIARAGRARCLRSGYSNGDRLRLVVDYIATKL